MRETFFGCINTLRDALIVIEGARQGLFPRVKHRPTLLDSVNIKSGSIFVWEQSEVKIVRWTDGKKWSNSKDIGAFVSYFERKEGEGDDEGSLDNRLHKKVTSVVTSDNLKFHLVAYYVPKDIASHLLKPPSSTLVEVPQKYYSRVKQHSSTNHWTQELSSRSPESTNELTVQKSSNNSRQSSQSRTSIPQATSNHSYSSSTWNHRTSVSRERPTLPPVSTLFEIADSAERLRISSSSRNTHSETQWSYPNSSQPGPGRNFNSR